MSPIIDTVPGVTRTPAAPAPRAGERLDVTAAVLATPGAGVQARRRGATYAEHGVTFAALAAPDERGQHA